MITGLRIKGDVDGDANEITSDIIFERNWFDQAGFLPKTAHNWIGRNNIMDLSTSSKNYNFNSTTGFFLVNNLFRFATFTNFVCQDAVGMTILNNTFFGARFFLTNIQTVSNNIFYDHVMNFSENSNNIFANNIFFSGTNPSSSTNTTVGSIFSNPLFVDLNGGDYNLQASSPGRVQVQMEQI